MSIELKLQQIDELNAQLDLVNIHKQDAINRVLAPEIKAELAAIDAEFCEQVKAINETLAIIEAEVKAGVVALGSMVKSGRYMAMYNKGRVTWDTKKMEGFAIAHPELAALRKEGEPFVTIKRV
jgi:hypothetical protein